LGQDLIRRAMESRRLAHANMFTGEDLEEKRRAAQSLAAGLLCSNRPGTYGGCGTCRECGLISDQAHPDFIVARPEGATIKLAQINALRREAAMQPVRGEVRVFVIEQADLMTREAANALLKTLEEPPGHSYFILLVKEPARLPDTVRSRCVPFDFGPLPVERAADVLADRLGLPRDEALMLASLAGGRVARAEEMAAEEAFLELKERADSFLERVPGLSAEEVLALAAEVAGNRADADLFISLLQHGIRLRLGRALEPLSCTDAILHLERIRSLLQSNVNPLLAIEALLLSLRSGLKRV